MSTAQPPFGIVLREALDDGSEFTNPPADYRRLFLGEDGDLHLRDSAGTVTDIAGGGSGVSDILDLTTAETDATLVLAPDGIGGVEFRAETGGGGSVTNAVSAASSVFNYRNFR